MVHPLHPFLLLRSSLPIGALGVAIGTLGVLFGCGGSAGDRGDDPYAGARIEIIVPFREGGGSDTWARAVAPSLQRSLGGGATVRVVNVLGASGVQGSNEFALRRPHDGLSLYVSSGSNALAYLLGERAVRYDFRDFAGVLGSPAGGVVFVASDLGITAIEGLCAAEGLVYGGISATGLDLASLLTFELLRIDVLPVLGYQGTGPARVAFEQGEVNLAYQTSPAYLANVVPLVEEGTAVPLFTFGAMDDDGRVIRDPVFPELPSFAEVYEECRGRPPGGIEWEAYRAVLSTGFTAQKGLWVHADAPPDRIRALRDAAARVVADTAFRSLTRRLLGDYEFYTGDVVERRFQATVGIPAEARAWLLDFLRREHDVTLRTRSE